MSATRPTTCRPTPTRSCTRPRCRARTSSCVTADELGVPVLHRSVALAAIADTAPHDRGRGIARQDHDVVDARARVARRRLATEFRDRRRGQRSRHQRRIRRGRVARRRSRRERRHVPATRARRRDRHQRRTRPSRLLRRLRRARRPRSNASSTACAGPVVLLRRRSRRRSASRQPGPRSGRTASTPERATTASSTSRPRVDVDRFTLDVHGGDALGELVVPLGVKAAHERGRRPRRSRSSSASTSTRSPRRSRGFGGVARRFQCRGERDGVTFIDDYAHLPSEVAAAIATARARAGGGA